MANFRAYLYVTIPRKEIIVREFQCDTFVDALHLSFSVAKRVEEIHAIDENLIPVWMRDTIRLGKTYEQSLLNLRKRNMISCTHPQRTWRRLCFVASVDSISNLKWDLEHAGFTSIRTFYVEPFTQDELDEFYNNEKFPKNLYQATRSFFGLPLS